jgi:hypothetical protein
MLYAIKEDPLDQEDLEVLRLAAKRLEAAHAVPQVDPLKEWLAKEARLFARCLEAVVEQLPSASPEDRRYAATVLFNRAAA